MFSRPGEVQSGPAKGPSTKHACYSFVAAPRALLLLPQDFLASLQGRSRIFLQRPGISDFITVQHAGQVQATSSRTSAKTFLL